MLQPVPVGGRQTLKQPKKGTGAIFEKGTTKENIPKQKERLAKRSSSHNAIVTD
jgi:hypothetical protein